MKHNQDLIEQLARDIYLSYPVAKKAGWEWDTVSEAAREEYRQQAIYLLARYHITRRNNADNQ